MIVATSSLLLSLVGIVAGALLGTLAPQITTYLYTFEGPDPPPSFDPLWFATIHGLAWGLISGVALGAGLAFVEGVFRLRFHPRAWMILVLIAACAAGFGWLARQPGLR